MERKTIEYKGFMILSPDKYYGYSLYDRKGSWACSMTSMEKIIETIEKIIEDER